MASPPAPILQPLYDFAARYIGRELAADERDALARLAGDLDAPHGDGRPPPLERAASLIDSQRQRVQASIGRMLENVDAGRQHATDAAALRAVEASASLDALRPSALRPPQAGETAPEQLLIAQIADRLAHLVRAEVNACFDRRFGPAAAAEHPPAGHEPDDSEEARDAGAVDAADLADDLSAQADD